MGAVLHCPGSAGACHRNSPTHALLVGLPEIRGPDWSGQWHRRGLFQLGLGAGDHLAVHHDQVDNDNFHPRIRYRARIGEKGEPIIY